MTTHDERIDSSDTTDAQPEFSGAERNRASRRMFRRPNPSDAASGSAPTRRSAHADRDADR